MAKNALFIKGNLCMESYLAKRLPSACSWDKPMIVEVVSWEEPPQQGGERGAGIVCNCKHTVDMHILCKILNKSTHMHL